MPAKKKQTHAEKIMAGIDKAFPKKKVAKMLKNGTLGDIRETIPTGIEVVDKYVLGIGGLPVGRIMELFAAEGVGKTSFMLQCLAATQRHGGVGILVETERALEAERAKTFGVDLDQLIILDEVRHLGDFYEQVEQAIRAVPKKVPTLLAWDSVAATMSKNEYDDGMDQKKDFDRRAKANSKGMRVLTPLLAEHQVSMLMVNQVRDVIGKMFGPDTSTPGGHAIKFHSSIRLCMYPGKSDKAKGGQHIGKTVTIQAVKNKLTPPWRKAKLKLNYAQGWNDEWSTLWHAKELKLVPARSRSHEAAVAALDAAGWDGAVSPDVLEEDEFSGEDE